MSESSDFILPEQQNANMQIVLAAPTSISGWSVQLDLLYRFFSPQPIVSLFLASGYSNGESGITLVDGPKGIFNASFTPIQISGISLFTQVLAYQTWRTDTGDKTPLNGGYRLLTPF